MSRSPKVERAPVVPRVVFDTPTVLSALMFPHGRLTWLRQHWRDAACVPLISRATAAELTRALAYPPFHLTRDDRHELLDSYLPYCAIVEQVVASSRTCPDKNAQPFLDLAHSGNAYLLVTANQDLLALSALTTFTIETPEAYRLRVAENSK